jgi:hypothetical protein
VKTLIFCLCAFLLWMQSAFAQISLVPGQNAATWGASGTSCVVTFTNHPSATNMIAVWTTWTTSGTNNVAASVQDLLGNNYHVAVGPTLQVSSNTAAQIFYATVTSGGSSDPVTVTFTSTVSSAGCVIAEYSGIDR